MKTTSKTQHSTGQLRSLYLVGFAAALIAALVFRRNLGAAELPLFFGQQMPETVAGWFTLLNSNSLLGLTLLSFFDILNYVLVALMFLAVYAALKPSNKSISLIAVALCFLGTSIFVVSNPALPMLSLSNQYAEAATGTQQASLLAAGQAVLSSGYDPNALYQSAGYYLSLSLVATAGLLASAVMLKSKRFGKITACIGIVASVLDLSYLAGLVIVPSSDVALFGAALIAPAGFFLMVWHLLVGWKLYRLSRSTTTQGGGTI